MADEESKPKSNRCFASMAPEKRREITSKSGKWVPKEKRSFATDRTLAATAGREGGQATPPPTDSVAWMFEEFSSYHSQRDLSLQIPRTLN